MAYMFDGQGPYPNKAGEFCGNWPVGYAAPLNMRKGRPRPSEGSTTAELELQGVSGLYWLTDQGTGAGLECNRGKEIIEVPTPPALTEPVASEDKPKGCE